MNTFLPYSNFKECAKVLDWKRLGKQRVESMQILNTLERGSRWEHHPAVGMWIGYEEMLKLYMNCMILEWIHRGYRNTMKIVDIDENKLMPPYWLGMDILHDSHRSNLLRKDFDFYSAYKWNVSPDDPYFWPLIYDKKIKEWQKQ